MRRLEQAISVAEFRGRGQPQPADQRRAQIGEDVAELVLGHDHVERLRVLHHVQAGRIHIGGFSGNRWVPVGHVEEHPAEEREAAEHVRLVHARYQLLPVERPAGAPGGDAEG